jgi:hypothetical protein
MKRKLKLSVMLTATTMFAFGYSFVTSKTAEAIFGVNAYISVSSGGTKGNAASTAPDISLDGRYIVFSSSATNLVSGDTNGFGDVFLRDTFLDTTTRVSVDSTGTQSNGGSSSAKISGNGKFIFYASSATNLVSGDTNASSDIFKYDVINGTTTRVSVDSTGTQSNGGSSNPDPDATGRFVVFETSSTNLAMTDTNANSDVVLKDSTAGTTTYMSQSDTGVLGNGGNGYFPPKISCDGRFVLFASGSSNLVASDTNGFNDVFLTDMLGTRMITNITLGGNGTSYGGDLSCDGRYLIYSSDASNQIASDTNGQGDTFRYDRLTSTKQRANIKEDGAAPSDGAGPVTISADGRFIVFYTTSGNYTTTTTDSNNKRDLFLRDMTTNTIKIVSMNTTGTTANNESAFRGSISGGNRVVFSSIATDLISGDTSTEDVFTVDGGPAGTCIVE